MRLLIAFLFGYLGLARCRSLAFGNSACPSGVCTKMYDCPEAYSNVQKNGYHNLLRCGFFGFIEIVCCPPQNREIITLPRPSEIACQKYKKFNILNLDLSYQIAGGVDSKSGEYPFMAALAIYDETVQQYKFRCGGILISENYVLTAAHCLWNQEGEVKIVTLGALKIRRSFAKINETVDYQVEKAVVHPNFNRHKKLNDIGLIKLTRSVEFKPELRPACLFSKISYPEELVIIGWGEVDKPDTDILQKAFVNLHSSEDCKKKYRRTNQLTENHLCAQNDKSDICGGDSGGPLLERRSEMPTVVGISSFGQGGGCMGGSASVYTSVSKYLNWIESVVWNSSIS